MTQQIAALSNSEITWDGNMFGLSPTVVGENAKSLSAYGAEAIPGLLPVLADPDKFVAAHVLLTRLSGVEYQTFPAWNGLVVNIAADGTVTIDPAQQTVLHQQWELWAKAEPHPTRLPEVK